MSNIKIIGWIGSILLAICGLPLAINSIINGHSNGISSIFLWMWLIGEILTMIYVYILRNKDGKLDIPLLFNYGLNILFILVVLYYKYFPNFG